MMSELFDEEVLRKQYNVAERKIAYDKGRTEGRAEGKAEGRAEGRAEGKNEGRIEAFKEALSNMIANGIDETKAKQILGLN